MDPLGSITVYFPFIDKSTRDILEKTMKEAYDYSDFVKRLTEMVLETTCSDLVVYFTIHHTLLLYDLKDCEVVCEKYKDRTILLPNILTCSAVLGNAEINPEILKAADAVLETNPDDWLALEMQIIKFETEMWDYPDIMYDESNLEMIVNTIKNNPQFRFYESVLFDNFAHRAMADGNSEDRISYLEKGLACAEEFDDHVRITDFLNKKARILYDIDRNQSREILLRVADISKSLGLKTDYAISQDRLSEIEAIRGEYNLAIEHYQESITIMESVGFPSGNVSLALSTLYTVIGEYDSGFEWGLMAQEQFQNRPYLIPRAILNQAWAQILLSNSTEGLILIDSIRDAVTKSGRETHIAWLHFVTGILEIADGDLISAASSIEEALKIYENRDGTMMVQMIFLRYLAEIEVALSGQEASICPSLCILEEKSTAEDLPGIFGQALLLKAELALKQNDDSALREIIQQLRPLTEMSSMQFLKPRFDSLLSRI